jgi:hypothetical protein
MPQKLPERFSITSMDSMSSLSAIDECRDPTLIKPFDRDASAPNHCAKSASSPSLDCMVNVA